MFTDLFQPIRYHLEKHAVGKGIPDVTSIPNRWKLHDQAAVEHPFDHSLWDNVLKRHVKVNQTFGDVTGVNAVDYAGVTNDSDFEAYLNKLATTKPQELAKADQLAFWMNAYNALCIAKIVKHEKETGEKLKSINNLSGGDKGPVWNQVAGVVGGEDISLNTIEHERLRKTWAEPAVHACIVCASASCPNLRPEAFVASRLKEQMDDQMKDWMKNPTKGIKCENGKVTLSRIFLWFHGDFGDWNGIHKWLPEFIEDKAVAEKVRGGRLAVRYFGYDWQINRVSS